MEQQVQNERAVAEGYAFLNEDDAERLEEIKEICTQAEVHIIKDCGHGPHFPTEKCKEVNELMLSFLADTSTIV